MTDILLLLLLVLTAALTGAVIGLFLSLRSAKRQVESTIRNFLSSPSPDTPSPFAQTVDAMAQVMARGVIAQGKATLMGLNSGAVRQGQVDARAAMQSRFPALAALDSLSPQISKTLLKNPGLLNLVGGFLSKNAGSPGGSPGQPAAPTQGNGTRPALFKL